MVTGIGSTQTSSTTNMVSSVGGSQITLKEPVKSDRRSNKPIMEKRRRARINNCLNELKTLILDATKKDPARHTKLEKADILEKTVKHLQELQRQQSVMTQAVDPKLVNKFKAGFAECANEVSRFPGIDPNVKRRLLQHLTNYMNGVKTNELLQQQQQQQKNTTASQIFQTQQQQQQQAMQIHMLPSPPSSPEQDHSGQQIILNHHSQASEHRHHHVSQQQQQQQQIQSTINGYYLPNGLQVIPTRLPNGNIAIVLPQGTSHTTINATQQQHHHHHKQQQQHVPALIPIPSRTSSTSSAASTSSSPYDRVSREFNISPNTYTSPSPVNSYENAMDCQPSVIQHASSLPLSNHQSLQYHHMQQHQEQHYSSVESAPLSLVIKKIKEEDQPWRPW